jgi:Asp-tRNA(Asn)/Glu-tRNA(Gln) amidotransferase A subunit family amidase
VPRVTAVLEKQKKVVKDRGCIVEEAEARFHGRPPKPFETMRAVAFVQTTANWAHDDARVKDSIAWNVEQASPSSPSDRARRRAAQRALPRMAPVLERYDFLLCPSTSGALPREIEYPTQIDAS